MSNPLSVDLSAGPQPYGVLAFRGPDAAKFLQGQLSADVEELASGSSVMAGFHNAQGRALALLTLARLTPEDIFAVLPAELSGDVEARLRKLVFRSKVAIETPQLRPLGAAAGADPFGSYAFAWGSRQLLLAPMGRGPETGADVAAWELEDVRAGLPQVYAATREQFVAQMLNLDLLGAVSFDKGCYTGQEVIARAHYRGRVKRRLQRWHNASGTPLKPGDAARAPDGRGLAVVRVAGADAVQEILAVGAYDPADAQSAPTAADAATVTVSGPLPLPYALPAN